MKLYLVHTGFYDKSIDDGFFEQHTNILVVASSPYEAREDVKQMPEFIMKKMHIDGIKEIENVDGYELVLKSTNKKPNINTFNHYQVRFLKP